MHYPSTSDLYLHNMSFGKDTILNVSSSVHTLYIIEVVTWKHVNNTLILNGLILSQPDRMMNVNTL